MTIVNPLSTANLILQPTTTPVQTTEERRVDLRLEQMVRATVVEGGLDRALLEMNHRHYRAQSDVALQTGQKLTLQVLQTHPTLEFRVVKDVLGGRLSQLLPLLTQQYDWAKLLENLTQRPLPQSLPQSTTQVYQQLQQLLQPDGRLPVAIKNDLQQLPAQLQQLVLTLARDQAGTQVQAAVVKDAQSFVSFSPDRLAALDVPQLLRGLQGQFSQLQAAAGRPLPQAWTVETRTLLLPLQQSLSPQAGSLPPAPLPQMNELLGVLAQMRLQPSLPPQVVGELERLILQIRVQGGLESPTVGRPASPPAASTPAGATPNQGSQPPQDLSLNQPAAKLPTYTLNPALLNAGVYRASAAASPPVQPSVIPAEISTELQQLLDQVQAAQGKSGKIAPELLGRLEGLLDKLQQLPKATQTSLPILPGMEAISNQLTQLVQQGPQQPQGGQLGLLSQLFGFHLEAELLRGKKRAALASLKTSLLAMQKDFGEEVKEPLRRLELFQLCKARLGEEQVQFLPLPFSELEEGYLLMEQAQQEDEENADPPLQVSLSLRLSALGDMQVDMLYDKQGLHLRVACEDSEKMAYLQEHAGELEESIATVPLQGVSFAADARTPAKQLIERLLPEAVGMLDARI